MSDNSPVIYKEDIIDDNGKLNFIGTLIVISVCLIALNTAFNYLSKNIISKKDNN